MSRRDDYKWTSPEVAREKALLSGQISDLLGTSGADAVSKFLQERISYLQKEHKAENDLQCFVAMITLLDWNNRNKCLASPQIGQLAESARALLKAYAIHPETSNLSWLHGELELALAHSRRREGRFFEATWGSAMALFHARKNGLGDAGFPYLTTGLRNMRHGSFTLAFDAFARAEELSETHEHRLQARICRLQIMRLRCQWPDARALLKETEAFPGLSEEARRELTWEGFCLDAAEKNDLTGMINATGRSGSHRHPSYMLEVTLWVKAVASKAMLQRVPKVESIKRAFPQAISRGTAHYSFYETAMQLDLCYDNDIPMHLRLSDLGQHLAKAERLLTIDKELLFWGAASRWLARYHQPLMAVICAEQYKALCLRMTGGTSPDVLNLQLDYNPWGKKELQRQGLSRIDQQGLAATMPGIAASRLDRAAAVSKLTLGIAGVKIKSSIKKLFASAVEIERIVQEEYQEIGDHLIRAISAMRGPTIKLAQLISYATPQLPAPLQEALQKTQDAVHPLETDKIIRVIEDSLGKPVTGLFQTFERTPLAAASIGQIHRATLHDGTDVIVKAQYPGIREVIHSDLRLIRMAKFVFHRIFPSGNVDEVIDVNEAGLYEECDYLREARFQTQIADNFRAQSDIVIPRIHHQFSTREVLVMDYVDGQNFQEFCRTASRDAKQQAGIAIYRFAFTSLLRDGMYNADPHPGNYLFLPDGRVAFLDFGYSESYPQQRGLQVRALIRALTEGDFKSATTIFADMGYISDRSRFDFKSVEESVRKGLGFLADGSQFRFSEEFVKRGVFFALMADNRRFIRHPVEDVRLLRFLWCLHAVLGALEVEANWREILLDILDLGPTTTQTAS